MSIAQKNAYSLIDECGENCNKAIKLADKRYKRGIYTREEWLEITEIIINIKEDGLI